MNPFKIENCRSLMNATSDMNNSFNPEIYRERFQQSFNHPGSLSNGPMWSNSFDFMERITGFWWATWENNKSILCKTKLFFNRNLRYYSNVRNIESVGCFLKIITDQ